MLPEYSHLPNLQAQLAGLGDDDTDMKRQRDTPDASPDAETAEVEAPTPSTFKYLRNTCSNSA